MSGSLSQGGVAPQRGTTQDTPLMELNLGEENKEEGESRKNNQKKHYVMAGIETHILCLQSQVINPINKTKRLAKIMEKKLTARIFQNVAFSFW